MSEFPWYQPKWFYSVWTCHLCDVFILAFQEWSTKSFFSVSVRETSTDSPRTRFENGNCQESDGTGPTVGGNMMLDQRPVALSQFITASPSAHGGQLAPLAPRDPCAAHSHHQHVLPAKTWSTSPTQASGFYTSTGSPSTAGNNQQPTIQGQFIYRSAWFIGWEKNFNKSIISEHFAFVEFSFYFQSILLFVKSSNLTNLSLLLITLPQELQHSAAAFPGPIR